MDWKEATGDFLDLVREGREGGGAGIGETETMENKGIEVPKIQECLC
jgi:hypothetical protein